MFNMGLFFYLRIPFVFILFEKSETILFDLISVKDNDMLDIFE